MANDIISAISTPIGKNGIGVVRLSGKNCLSLATKMFTSFNKKAIFEPNKMVLGEVDLGEIRDKAFLVFFKSPHSYTGEDVVEFQCHGGIAVTQKILNKTLELGARLAKAGEFSKRAFLNGKISLDEAEGIVDIINAETTGELRASSELARGSLKREINSLQDALTEVLSKIDVNFDYPEEQDIESETREDIEKTLKKIKDSITSLLGTEERGRYIRSGVNIAIIGKTNVGKSSLLNALLNREQAIVTNIEGTTRDVVIGSIEYKDLKFNFFDTAGIRRPSNKIESIGIKKAKDTLLNSDIVLLVLDRSKKLDEQDKKNIKLIKDKKVIYVLNKCDLPKKAIFKGKSMVVSAKKRINTEKLKEEIYNLALEGYSSNSMVILTNLRHINVLKKCNLMLKSTLAHIYTVPLDCLAVDIKELWEKLGEITGKTVNETIIDNIFSKFCVGK